MVKEGKRWAERATPSGHTEECGPEARVNRGPGGGSVLAEDPENTDNRDSLPTDRRPPPPWFPLPLCVCAVVETQTQQRMGVCAHARVQKRGRGGAGRGSRAVSAPALPLELILLHLPRPGKSHTAGRG